MSLGGYKFRGYYCQKGSLTDAQWALLMHKTKVAAFMAANTAASAGWDYDMTGSPDGNYHCLDSVGNNYVTVFKRTNGENDYTWFALYTLTYATKTGTNTGSVQRSLMSGRFVLNSGYVFYVGTFACAYFRIGNSAISYNDSLLDLTMSNNGSTPLIPMANTATARNYSDSDYFGRTITLFNKTSNYYGFAIKGCDIIMFAGFGANTTDLCCSLASGNAFSRMIYDADTKKVFAANLQSTGEGGDWDEVSSRKTNGEIAFPVTACQESNGNTAVPAYLTCSDLAQWSGLPEEYPFISLSAFTSTTGKGVINVGLICANMPKTAGQAVGIYSSVAGGKLLAAIKTDGTYYAKTINNAPNPDSPSGYPWTIYRVIYVGWDPSNPDITQASSWTEFTPPQ